MTTRRPWPELSSKKKTAVDVEESIYHLHPLQRQHAIQLLHQQQQQQQQPAPAPAPAPGPAPAPPPVRASLSTVPASCRIRSRFLNLRDSVKKSPTRSTAKVNIGGSQIPWVPFAFSKVLMWSAGGALVLMDWDHDAGSQKHFIENPQRWTQNWDKLERSLKHFSGSSSRGC